MGQFDQDRFQKELAVRYCLARGMIPFVEVIVQNISDLSNSIELLTDLDVLGVEARADGRLSRTIVDCKTSNRMSSINRAFWACGVKEYTRCDEAFILLKKKALDNHRLYALSMNVDLHDEQSFIDLGKTLDVAFPADDCYQAQLVRWNDVYAIYEKRQWSEVLYNLVRNEAPLTHAPWSVFRKINAELRTVRGQFDPGKDEHVSIFFDILCSCFVIWAAMGRDIRRFYEPSMDKAEFETVLRYYDWGGKEAYNIRQQMRERSCNEASSNLELPGWDTLVAFTGLLLSAPQSIIACAYARRELSIRTVSGAVPTYDNQLTALYKKNNHLPICGGVK
jgi:hypothetical protein